MIAPSRLHRALIVAAYLVGYVGLDWVSYIYPVSPPVAITPWNPPPGLSLMLLLRGGLPFAPWLFVAALSAEVLVRTIHTAPLLIMTAAVLPAIVYTALAAFLQRRHFNPDFISLRDCGLFVASTACATGMVALGFVGMLHWGGLLPDTNYWGSASQFWIGDFLGIIVTTPLLLVLTRKRGSEAIFWTGETFLQIAVTLFAMWVIFGSNWAEELKLFYLLFLPVIWTAMRGGIERVSIVIAFVQVGLILTMWLGGYGAGAVLQYQFLLLSLALTGLFLGTTVSETRLIARELREKQIALERSVRLTAASEMASAMAHELNQPLSAIGSYLNACQVILTDPSRSVQLREIMDKTVAEVTRAAGVVRQIRDFFRTGSGRIEHLRVQDVLQSVLAGLRHRADAQHVRWQVDCPASLPAVLVDRVQLETVLHNLLANGLDAVKELPADKQHIAISARDDGTSVRISVSDSGTGISSDVKARLFTPFATSKPQGMGLGLAISRSLIEARGGRLWLEHDAPMTTFSFTLPVENV